MVYARLLRIWKGTLHRATHRRCGRPINWGIDDTNKHRPLDPTAKPIREEKDDCGRQFLIFDPSTAFHRCPAKKRPAPTAQQESFL